MAFSTTVQPVEKSSTPLSQPSSNVSDALLSVLLLSMYGAQMSKKSVRKLKRKIAISSFKEKLSKLNPFAKKRVTDRNLIYILLGVALIALLIIDPILVLALAVVVLILILAGVI